MRRALALIGLACAGCLDPSANVLALKDPDSPMVIASTPAPNAVVDKTAPIQITFGETMDLTSLEQGLLLRQGGVELMRSIVPPSGTPRVPPQIERENIPFPVEVVPSAPLAGSTAFELVLTTAITDFEGNPLPQEIRIPFTTRP